MKKLLLLLPIVLLTFAACNKKNDDSLAFNTWTVNGQLYKAMTVTRLPGTSFINASDGGSGMSGNNLTILFQSEPHSGTYRIVDYPAADNEAGLLVQHGSITNLYRSKAADEGLLYVRVEDKKVSVYVAGTVLYPALPTQSATITLAANILESR